VGLTGNAQQLQLELSFDLLPTRVEIRSMPNEGQVLIRLPDTHLQQGLVIAQPLNEHIKTISLVPTSAGLDVIVAITAGQHISTSQQAEPHNAKLVVGFDFPAVIPSSVEVTAAPAGQSTMASVALPPVPVTKPNVTAAASPVAASALVRTQLLPETAEQLVRRCEHWTARTARLFAAACAERVLPIYEAEYPGDDRPREAIAAYNIPADVVASGVFGDIGRLGLQRPVRGDMRQV